MSGATLYVDDIILTMGAYLNRACYETFAALVALKEDCMLCKINKVEQGRECSILMTQVVSEWKLK